MRKSDIWQPASSVHEALVAQVERLDIAADGMTPPQAFMLLRERFLPDLALQAAKELAESHRRFFVGLGAMVLNVNPNIYTILRTANWKPFEIIKKFCGEMALVETVKAEPDLTQVVGFFIVGESNRDHGSGILSDTLDCCEACREMFVYEPDIVPEQTAVWSLNPATGASNFTTVGGLLDKHGRPTTTATLPHYQEATAQYLQARALPTVGQYAPGQNPAL